MIVIGEGNMTKKTLTLKMRLILLLLVIAIPLTFVVLSIFVMRLWQI